DDVRACCPSGIWASRAELCPGERPLNAGERSQRERFYHLGDTPVRSVTSFPCSREKYETPDVVSYYLGHALSKPIRALALALALGIAMFCAAPAANAATSRSAGLWIGDVTLVSVSYAPTGAKADTRSVAQMRILLHVDATGTVRLLKDVIIATRST